MRRCWSVGRVEFSTTDRLVSNRIPNKSNNHHHKAQYVITTTTTTRTTRIHSIVESRFPPAQSRGASVMDGDPRGDDDRFHHPSIYRNRNRNRTSLRVGFPEEETDSDGFCGGGGGGGGGREGRGRPEERHHHHHRCYCHWEWDWWLIRGCVYRLHGKLCGDRV